MNFHAPEGYRIRISLIILRYGLLVRLFFVIYPPYMGSYVQSALSLDRLFDVT